MENSIWDPIAQVAAGLDEKVAAYVSREFQTEL